MRPIKTLNRLAMLADWQLRDRRVDPIALTLECLARSAELAAYRQKMRSTV
jgi:hypothetical protein